MSLLYLKIGVPLCYFFFQFSFFSIPSVGEEWIFYETNFGNLKVEGNRGADLEDPRGLQPPFSLIFQTKNTNQS